MTSSPVLSHKSKAQEPNTLVPGPNSWVLGRNTIFQRPISQDLGPRSLAQVPSQEPVQNPSQEPAQEQHPQTLPHGTNGNLTLLSPSPTRPAQPQESEDEDPYQILIVAKEEPGDGTVTEEEEEAASHDDSRGQRPADGQDPLQEDSQVVSQNLLAEAEEGNMFGE